MAISEKDKNSVKTSKKTDVNKSPIFRYMVSEGHTVIFDLRQFLNCGEFYHYNIKSYSFHSLKQISGAPVRTIKQSDQTISFKAPYLRDNDLNIKLEFELTIAAKDNKTKDMSATIHKADVTVKRVQRAIVFQGGVALGAYEAGVFHALVKKLSQRDQDEGRTGIGEEKRPLFDIVAGTSIGGMNAAVVVSNIINGNSWQDSAQQVIKFWKDQEYPWPTVAENLDKYPIYRLWWDTAHRVGEALKHSAIQLTDPYSNINSYFKEWNSSFVDIQLFLRDYFIDGWYIPATAEAARRYYSAKQIETFGAHNVAAGIWPWSILGKFFDFTEPDNLENSMPRPDNKHFAMFSLKRTLERFADFPIKTKEGQPRFLLVAVDVQTGDAVTFDSYYDKSKYHDDRSTIDHKDGIGIEHALATGTFPDFFDYPKFKVYNSEIDLKDQEHNFWDGGFRSNTPLREVIQAHRDYWYKTRKQERNKKEGGRETRTDDEYEDDVPDLEIYIADLWPSQLKEEPTSFDLDFVEDRKWDIILGDKTDYDEQVANVITDYVDLVRGFKNLAERRGASKEEINYLLKRCATSKNTKGLTRIYEELLQGRFRLNKVVRIDHIDDGNDVSKKIFDYSHTTIENLMEYGCQDALVQMDMQQIKDRIAEIAKIIGCDTQEGNSPNHMQKLEEDIHQIQENMKIQNGRTRLNELIVNFVNSIEESISDNSTSESGLCLKEEKASLISAAKQFQDAIKNRTTIKYCKKIDFSKADNSTEE